MGRSPEAFIGIDVACAKGKRLPVVVCTRVEGRLVPLPLRNPEYPQPPAGQGNRATLDSRSVDAFALATVEYLREICNLLELTPSCIAIDAPSAPRRESERSRNAEKALSEAGISCFSTPSESEFSRIKEEACSHLEADRSVSTLPHANKLWMLVGFALFDRLAEIAPCIEVFPNAIARSLGCTLHKFKPGGVEAQLRAAAKYTGWPDSVHEGVEFYDIASCPAHDRLDSYLSAWVASLPTNDRFAYGGDGKEAIWVPRLEGAAAFPEAAHTVYEYLPQASADAEPQRPPKAKKKWTAAGEAGPLSRLCPACSKMLFKRWPWGWDGHAAVCAGLAENTFEDRKAEFRRRFFTAARPDWLPA